jgi:outer membrane lipoprotein
MAVIRKARFIGTCLVLLVLGCATGVSPQARSQVTYGGSFSKLQGAVGQHKDEIVIFGGKIMETKGYESASEITVLQLPLDRRDRPEDGDQSEGRYLIRSGQFLDPAIYEKGSLLTVVGRISGSEVRPIGEFQYVYPVVEPVELKLWPRDPRMSPRFRFGIGVGTWF